MSFVEDMKKQGLGTKTIHSPVWSGPDGDGSNGGISFSLLSRFLVCRERFRIHMVEGLQPTPTFNHKIEYGNLWHTCEEALAAGTDWKASLKLAGVALKNRYRFSQDEVTKWVRICSIQFPIYVEYWKKSKDVVKRKPLLQEQVFDVRYELPSKRFVRLRGKWDSVDLIEKEIVLQENKSKGDIDERAIKRQLKWDLQTMQYMVALEASKNEKSSKYLSSQRWSGYPIRGITYNVIQRPLSGEKGTIRQKQTESEQEYYTRLQQYFMDEPERYFLRWKIPVSQDDINSFRRRTLDPILENLCDWWDHMIDPAKKDLYGKGGSLDPYPHYITPYGVYNVLLEGGYTDIDDYLLTGSTVGLTRIENLFPELQP